MVAKCGVCQSSISEAGCSVLSRDATNIPEFRTNILPDERILHILCGTVHAVRHLYLAQTSDEEALSSTTALTGVGSEVLPPRDGTSIDILVEKPGQREEKK